MKKILKYLSFIPFAVCIGSLLIYFVYTIQIKFSKRVIVTESLTNNLKLYLIIALISLFIGLLIVLLKKIYNLLKAEKNVTINKVKEEKLDDVIKIKLKNPKLNGEKIVGKLEDTMQNVEVYIDDNKNYNFKLDGISCPECKGLISKNATICPHCGILFDEALLRVLSNNKTPVVKKKTSKKIIVINIFLILLFIILILLVSNVLLNKGKENSNNINPVVLNEEKA